jgi:serine/threonine protein kinase
MNRCPSSQQLEQLLDERLPDTEYQVVSLHVDGCAACQAALEQLTTPVENGGSLSEILRRQENGNTAAVQAPLTPFLSRLKETSVLTLLSSTRSGETDTPARGAEAEPRTGANGVPVIPGYEIVSELGRGGMGIVYKARQVGLNRLVALKMILAGPHARPQDLDRFRQEAEAVARLHHPNIVQIYEIGDAAGIAYFALEYVEDGNLVQRLRGDPQPLDPAVRLVETLARTIHFAHQRGVVHRDLKPANILLVSGEAATGECYQEHEETQLTTDHSPLSTHQPKITDFGLAKRLDEKSTGTSTGEVVGTPSYMAPEQAAGSTNLIGAPADVYALGAILYEMLTGRPPFKGATALDTVIQVLHEEPVRPSRLRPRLPHDLETICLKCLNKDPSRRYGSAELLADDLQRFRKGKPILGRPVSIPERAWKWARRRPLTAALLVGMILSVVLGFAGVTWQWQEARQARDLALEEQFNKEIQRAEAIEERSKAQLALYYSRIAQSQLQWRVNNVPGAVQSLTRCVPLPNHEDRRGWEWHYLFGLFHTDLFTFNHPLTPKGGNAAYHPNGRSIISVVGGHPTDDDMHPGEVRVWDAASGDLLQTYHAPGTAHRVVFRPDGVRLALAGTDGQVMVWHTATGKEFLRATIHAQMIAGLAFSPDGQLLATASWDQSVKICNATTGQVLHVLQGHTGRVQSVAFHPDGTRLASGDWDAIVKIWDTRTGRELLTLSGHKSPVNGVAFTPDGALLATVSSNGNVKLWDMATGRVTQSLTARSGSILGNSFSPDGRYLA